MRPRRRSPLAAAVSTIAVASLAGACGNLLGIHDIEPPGQDGGDDSTVEGATDDAADGMGGADGADGAVDAGPDGAAVDVVPLDAADATSPLDAADAADASDVAVPLCTADAGCVNQACVAGMCVGTCTPGNLL